MEIYSTYSVKIKHYNKIFKETIKIYRNAVEFFISVCLDEWDSVYVISGSQKRMMFIESLTHKTKDNPQPAYDFDTLFYKFPSYLRRAAIAEAIGKVSSYKSNLANWKTNPVIGKEPSLPKAGYVYPCMYRDNMYRRTGTYEAQIKVFIRNTWDWLTVDLRKSDVNYINKHCNTRKEGAPVLQKRGKQWFLDFSFSEKVELSQEDVSTQTVLAVDLGINNACTCCVMKPDGTILGRHFLKLPSESDSLVHAINRIKKAQQHGARRMPRLWAKAKGINDDIAVKTAVFIMDKALLYNVDVIVFEHLDLNGKIRGSKKQRLHLWKAKRVQAIVTDRAHRHCMRIRRVNAWNTSRLAYDGSGYVERGIDGNYSICRFRNGKVYNCDLSASYNIGARYFIREHLKSLPATARLDIEAKVPQCAKRSTCTLSTLISLHAVLTASAVA